MKTRKTGVFKNKKRTPIEKTLAKSMKRATAAPAATHTTADRASSSRQIFESVARGASDDQC